MDLPTRAFLKSSAVAPHGDKTLRYRTEYTVYLFQ
jgi:hypothetical protein